MPNHDRVLGASSPQTWLWTSLIVLSPLLSASSAAAQAPATHSEVNAQGEAVAATANQLRLVFAVRPASGLHINLEGPWALTLKNPSGGVSLAKTGWTKADLDDKLPGFVAQASVTPQTNTGDVDYDLVAFVCTDDKTQCYRDVHHGRLHWQRAAPAKGGAKTAP